MGREEFKSKALRGLPMGLLSGFMYGCLILLIALVLGMDDELFIPLLVVAMVLGAVIGIISGIGKSIEADGKGIYLKNKEYLFAENDMYMQVYTHYYGVIPVTERSIKIDGKDGKRKVKCTFLGAQDAGRLAKIIEDGMREKNRTVYENFERNDAAKRTFHIPAIELIDKIDQRNRLLVKTLFWFLTIFFALMLIAMIRQDQLAEHGLGLVFYMIVNVLILGGISLFICGKAHKAMQNIPCEIVLVGGQCYVDGKPFREVNLTKVVMTPERGDAKGDMRRLVFYDGNDIYSEYSFGFRSDRTTFPEYGQLVEAVRNSFGSKFAYDIN